MSNFRLALYGWLILSALMASANQAQAQWNQFRGPNGSGVDSATGYPVAFSPSTNVVWKAAVPFGQSSPVVAGGRVYLTASDGDRLLTICLDAATGREVWRREIPRAQAQKTYHANDPASPTAAADDDGVVVFFADFGLVAYTADGKDRWTLPLGPFKSFYGMAASPILIDNLVVMRLRSADRFFHRGRRPPDRAAAVEKRAHSGAGRLGHSHGVPARRRRDVGAADRAGLDASRRLRARERGATLVDAGRIEWVDGHGRGERYHAVLVDRRKH